MSSRAPHLESLTHALREASKQAATCSGGGCAILYAAVPGDDSTEAAARLRAASGFQSPEEARQAASSAMQQVKEAIEAGAPAQLPDFPALGERGSGGAVIWPLQLADRVHGALLVAGPEALAAPARAELEALVASLGLQLDHAHLAAEVDRLRNRASVSSELADEKSDELLKLSEELFAQDIELLRNNEKLGKIEKLKNDFIEKMSLELRTPLNSIIEAIITVLAGEHESLSESSRSSLRTALDEGTAFQRTLENILDLWRIKQGELPIERQQVNFGEVIEEAIFSVQEALDASALQVEKQVQEPLPRIVTDLAKVNRVLFLLLDNATKFTAKGGISIEARVEAGDLVCTITDSGIGICPDDQQFIFDEFFQVDDLATSTYRGAGLGLTLVRDLLLLLDGDCTVESEPGRGTSVTFRIPAHTV